jgi:hypothetical protein
MRGMGCALYIGCALSIHQKECRYLPENTVIYYSIIVNILKFHQHEDDSLKSGNMSPCGHFK